MMIHGNEYIRIYSPSKKQQIPRLPNDSNYAASRDDLKDDQSPIPSGRRFCSGELLLFFRNCFVFFWSFIDTNENIF